MLLFGREKTINLLGEEEPAAGAQSSNGDTFAAWSAGADTTAVWSAGAGATNNNTGTATLEFLPMKQVSHLEYKIGTVLLLLVKPLPMHRPLLAP